MKIQIIETTTKRPLASTKVQIQVKGKDSGFLSLTTDASGHITLDEKYTGQQITATNGTAQPGTTQGQWLTAAEGARLMVHTGAKQTTTESTGGSHK